MTLRRRSPGGDRVGDFAPVNFTSRGRFHQPGSSALARPAGQTLPLPR